MKKLFCLLIALALMASSALAATEWPVDKHVFSNGLTLLTLEDRSTPAVNFQIWFHVGSKNEHPGITGISHLFEHLMFMGTDKVGKEEHSKIIQKHGGLSNAYTSFDMTVYHEDIGKDQLDLVLDLESDRLQNLKINDANLATERQVVLEERGFRVENSPFLDVLEQLFANAYQAYPYGWYVVGWRADLESLTLKQCLDYFHTYYNPANAVMVIAGDVNTADVIKQVDKYFGKIPGNPSVPRPVWDEPVQRGERRVDFHKVSQLPAFIAGYHTPADGQTDTYALNVLARILSGGESSRLYKKMVYDEQIALAAGGENGAREAAGLFYAYAFMQPGKTTAEGEKSLYAEIDRMKTEPVTDQELQKAKNQIEAEFYMGSQSNSDKASQLGSYQTLQGDYKLLFQQADKYAAVTKEDIMRVAKKYLDSRNRTVITVIQEQQGANQLGMKEEK
jgi:predicted Zn-dependent peptidase